MENPLKSLLTMAKNSDHRNSKQSSSVTTFNTIERVLGIHKPMAKWNGSTTNQCSGSNAFQLKKGIVEKIGTSIYGKLCLHFMHTPTNALVPPHSSCNLKQSVFCPLP